MRPSTRRIFSGASTAYAGLVGGSFLGFLYTFIAARLFGPAALGAYTLVFSYMTIFSLVACLGMQNSILKFVPPAIDKNDWEMAGNHVCIIILIVFSVSVLLAGTLFVFSQKFIVFFKKTILEPYFRASVILLPLLSINLLCYFTFRATRLIKYESLSKGVLLRTSKIFILFLLIAACGTVFDSKWLLLFSSISGEFIVLITSYLFLLKKSPLRLNVNKLIKEYVHYSKQIISFSVPLMFAPFLQFGLTQGNILIMGFFLDVQHIGVYKVAFQLAFLLAMLLEAFETVVAPMISEDYAKRNLEKMRENYILATNWITITTIPLFIIILIVAQDMMALLGRGFSGKLGSSVLIILATGQMINAATGTAVYTLILTGRQKLFIVDTIISLILNITLSFFLIPKYGIIGAAIGSAASIALVNLLAVIQVYLILKMHPYSKKYYKQSLAGIISFISASYLYDLIKLNGLASIAIISLCCLIIYSSSLIMLGLEPEEKAIFQQIAKKFNYTG